MTDTKRELNKALGWFGSATLVMRVLDVVSTIAVLHFLSREQLGVASLSLGVTIIAEALSGLGVAGAIVQAPSVSREQQHSLFWWCIGVALTLASIVWGCSGWIAQSYDNATLAPLIAASGVKFVTVGAALVPLHVLMRELKFKEVSVVQTGASLGEAATKLVLAASGLGAWALVLSNVLRGVYLFVLLAWVTRFWPRLRFAPSEVRPFVAFGLRASMASLISETYRNLDYFLVGKYLGMSTLGVYRVAFDVAMTPAEAIAQPIYRVTLPLFSRLADDAAGLRVAFLRASRYMLALTGPVAVFLSFSGGDLLGIIKAGEWTEAAPALGILCWAALLRVSTRLFSNLFMARGRPDLALVESTLTLILLTASMVTLLELYADRLGILAVCYAWLLAYPVLFSVFWRLSKSVIEVPFGRYLGGLLPIAVALVAAWCAGAALSHWGPRVLGDSAWPHLIGSALVIGGAFVGVLRWGAGIRLSELRQPGGN